MLNGTGFYRIAMTVLSILAAVAVHACAGRDRGPTSPTDLSLIAIPALGPSSLSGTVVSAVTGGPLREASIQLSVAGHRYRTVSDASGRYGMSITGVSASVEVTVSLAGFVTQTTGRALTGGDIVNFALRATAQPVPLAGEWTTTLSAAPSCQAILPPVAFQRSYDLTITQEDAQAILTFRSPTLEHWPIGYGQYIVSASVVGDELTFTIIGDTLWDNWLDAYFIDHPGPGEAISVSVHGSGRAAGDEIWTTMKGIVQYSTAPLNGRLCDAPDHAFVFRRR